MLLCAYFPSLPPSLPPSHRTTHFSRVVSVGSSCKSISWVLIPPLLDVCSMPPSCQTRHIGRRERETANSPHPRRQRTRLGPAEGRSRARRRRKRRSLEGKATRFNSFVNYCSRNPWRQVKLPCVFRCVVCFHSISALSFPEFDTCIRCHGRRGREGDGRNRPKHLDTLAGDVGLPLWGRLPCANSSSRDKPEAASESFFGGALLECRSWTDPSRVLSRRFGSNFFFLPLV